MSAVREPSLDLSMKPHDLAAAIATELENCPVQKIPDLRVIRQKYTRLLKPAGAGFVLAVSRELRKREEHRWAAYELVGQHNAAFASLDDSALEAFGEGNHSWWTVDAFARTLSGPAWMCGQISDETVQRWALSPDPWWRRAALVSTVAFNTRSLGGPGDTPRILAVCRLLAADHGDMVLQALSWALRQLVSYDRKAVQAFLDEYQSVLAARVKREVSHKLRTGLKNPRC